METATFVDATALPVNDVLVLVFVAGDEIGFFVGDAVEVVFLTVDEVVLLLLTFETVDVRLVTELALVAVVAVLVAVVLDAAVPTVLTLLVAVLDDPWLVLLIVVDVEVADAVLLTVDGAVRGFAAGTVDKVRAAVELGFAGADVVDFVVAVNGLVVVDFAVVPDNLALGPLLLLLVVVAEVLVAVDAFTVVVAVKGFLAVVVAVLTSPLTAEVAGFLAIKVVFFSAGALLFAAVPAKLVRVVDGAVDGFAAPTDRLVEETVEVFFTVLVIVEGFVAVEDLVGAGFGGSLAAIAGFLSAVDGFVAVFVAPGLVVPTDLVVAVAFCVPDFGTAADFGSSTGLTSGFDTT